MARRATGYMGGRPRPYTPEALDNRKAPKANRVEVTILQPVEGEKIALLADQEGEILTDVTKISGRQSMAWLRAAIVDHVAEVRNYEAQDGTAITNGLQLWEWGESEFQLELAMEILTSTSLGEGEKKRSKGSRGSSSRTTRGSRSTAKRAKRTGKTSAGAVH